MRPTGSPKKLEVRRARAIALLQRGLKPVEVARQLKVDRRSVRRWNAEYRAKGEAGLKAKPAPGRPARLNTRQKSRLERLLIAGAQAGGFVTDLWTCPRIAQLIREHFGVSYHVDHVCRLLHSLGWSPQRPSRRAVERDELRIQNWIRVDWPRIKKKSID
jgi:putative transposase